MDLSQRIKDLTLELTSVLGVVGTKEENDVADKVYQTFEKMDYFKDNPEHLRYVDAIDDKLGRKSVLAMVKGKKGNSNKTVLMIGHTDTVGISDFGELQEYATKPEELIEKLKTVTIPDEAREDLESGKYMFGRGIFDMKFGVATLMVTLEEISNNLDEFEGNLVFAAVCDEEGNSAGMMSVVPEFVKLQESEGFEYQALIDTDYSAPRYVGDENRYVYIGTVGKLMPSFFVVGKETHVGEPYKGLDPNQIASEITSEINLNMDFCDEAEGEVSLPPITLRQQDLKPEYSVQIARYSYVYFNYATHTSTPDEVMEKMLGAAKKAFDRTLEDVNSQYKVYCEQSDYPYEELPWKSRVISYADLVDKVREERGQALDDMMEKYSKELLADDSLDQRDFALHMTQAVHNMWSDKDPIVVVYFSPPYYPHIYVEGTEPKEKKLIDAVDLAIENAGDDFSVVRKKFYPYISDLSYAAAPKEDSVIEALKGNMPGFGESYDLPIKDMQILDLPVVNIGPFGKDAHKFTERLEIDYSFNVLPGIVYDTIMGLLK